MGRVLMRHLRPPLCQLVALCSAASNRSQNVPTDQPSCLSLTVCPSLVLSDLAFRCSGHRACMNGGLLHGSHAGNKVMFVSSPNIGVYVTSTGSTGLFMRARDTELFICLK